ncbi:GNAT family N-acetyltransferase [Anaerosporobacter faecicola]|uniref:GNAT family N-acetyltransferase n=1 Tax=Anaerosporobacter faecicola TaxID=2718714 RepID=UPI00143B97E4|nr:GNAT family N-acetyltransferase [Anaerosporobacter faecicola]
MQQSYRIAKKEDAKLLVELYNQAFYADYIKYGQCPAYGRSVERMEESIAIATKHIIEIEGKAVGVVSLADKGEGIYYLGCLCVIPAYQHKGIGTKAMEYILSYYKDWKEVTLITPADKEENVVFYTKKCGFSIREESYDGNVKVYTFVKKREV